MSSVLLLAVRYSLVGHLKVPFGALLLSGSGVMIVIMLRREGSTILVGRFLSNLLSWQGDVTRLRSITLGARILPMLMAALA